MSNPEECGFQVFKPKQLIEGVSLDEIKEIPVVEELVKKHVDEEIRKARELGLAEGRKLGEEQGRKEAYTEALSEYEAKFQSSIENIQGEISELIMQLKAPLSNISEESRESLEVRFKEVMSAFVANPEVYDRKLVGYLDDLIESLAENKRNVVVHVGSNVSERFFDLLSEEGVDVQRVEMNDLFRVYSEKGDYRFNVKEFVDALLK